MKKMQNGDVNIIRFTNLKVWTPEEKSWWRRKVTRPKMTILNNVTGSIKNGDFIAVLGPSGAGKTTFLACLAGKCTLPLEGTVTVKGINVKEINGAVEIVPQIEVFMSSLSVLEHLVFMTEMKLGDSKKIANKTILDKIIYELKLKPHVNTMTDDLSGGERKLLSLATSLLSKPEILICDEPTTGLDSYNASLVVNVLKKLSTNGKVVVCSVHQPSSYIFKEFDSIMLMADGKLLFHGSQDSCKDFFDSLGLHCPKNFNPAEFCINKTMDGSCAQSIAEFYEKSQVHEQTGSSETFGKPKMSQRNWCVQVYLLLWRSSLNLRREVFKNLFQLLICTTMSSIVLATCYAGISGTTQRGVQDIRGFLWLVCSEVSFSVSYGALYLLEGELTLFRREVGVYCTSAYFASSFFGQIPRCVLWPISLVAIASIAVDLPNYLMTSMEFIAALIISAIAAAAYGLGMAALFTSTGVLSDVTPCADLLLFLMSGAFLRISTLPIWLYPVKFVSHFFYSMEALSNIYWSQIQFIECPQNSTSCVDTGTEVLIENGYANDFILQDNLGLLFVTLLWCLLGYFGLKREEKKGYAY